MYFPFILVYSLQCYNCLEVGSADDEESLCSKSKLDSDEARYVQNCSLLSLDTCQRTHATALDLHSVTMICTTSDLCEATKKTCEDSGDDCGVACCTTDKCNASSSVSFSFVLVVISSALYLVLLMMM